MCLRRGRGIQKCPKFCVRGFCIALNAKIKAFKDRSPKTLAKRPKGPSINYVSKILPIFDPPP